MTEVSYTVTIHDEGPDGFWAEVEDLPGCFASGATMAELDEALDEAVGIYLSAPGSRLRATPVSSDEVHVETKRYLVGT